MNRKSLILFVLLLLMATVAFAQGFGQKQRAKRPHEYGNVVINNYSEANNIAPVVFNHWLHRAKYTCRLCHVDLGFGMAAGSTGMTEEDNINGIFCGACHDGAEAFGSHEKDTVGNVVKNCYRCHSYKKNVRLKENFYAFFKGYPRARYGNKVDWLKAEESGLVKLKDYLEGHSIPMKSLRQTKDINIKSKELGIPDIIFSHKKHTIWVGCELCHPDIFGIKKGATKYTMQDIFEGRFCGACHGKVAFPYTDCMLCHSSGIY